jgi:hypothetical protein
VTDLRTQFAGVVLCLFAGLNAISAQAVASPETPDLSTLQRLAEQLGRKAGQAEIDQETLQMLKEFLKKNPNILQSPEFQKMLQEQQAKLEKDPALQQAYQKKFSTKQLEQLKEVLPSVTGRGGSPSGTPQPGTPQPSTPQPGTPQPGKPSVDLPDRSGDTNKPQPTAISNPAPMPPPMPVPVPPPPPPPPAIPTVPPTQPGATPESQDVVKQLAQKNKEFGEIANMWEKNVGPLDKTPALKQSLIDMFQGTAGGGLSGGLNGNGLNPKLGPGNGPLNMDSKDGAGSVFGNWLKDATSNGGPNWFKELKANNWGKSWLGGNGASGWTPPTTGSLSTGGFGSSFGGSFEGVGTVGLIFFGLIFTAVLGFLLYRYWPQIRAMRGEPKPLPGLGAWTIDPRSVQDRETLVRAFDYLSVAICGDGARVWNHITIAEAFREQIPESAAFAEPLARLYALARYTPAQEEISLADIAEARGYLCQLAGVPNG